MNSRVSAAILSAVSFLILTAGAASAHAQNAPAIAPAKAASSPTPVKINRTILVSLEDHRLALLEDGAVKAIYPVAVGKASTPSPTGTFTIVNHVINPTYYHHGEVIPPGPENPVGNRWMGLSVAGYGIHGTNAPRSIGKAVSHGCIRMSRRDLDELFAQVRIGDTVEIVAERNEETAAIFGEPAAAPRSVAAPAPVLTAMAAPASPAVSAPGVAALAAAIPVAR
ncbi:MAG TPA: L,D-transpeptidase [Acidobacteriaceae bacterium]|jgi:lipoprotein-anchoring transpeptidase ErfK/SrfK|nr:L,D-transpeptidase [Acidobacteriaceae bacterium]